VGAYGGLLAGSRDLLANDSSVEGVYTMEMKRTAHAYLGEGGGEASARPSAQQPCAGERIATDLLYAKLGTPRCGTTKRRFGSAKL